MMKRLVFAALTLSSSLALAAPEVLEQPTGTTPFAPDIFAARRAKLRAALKTGVALVQSLRSGEHGGDADYDMQNPDFLYLTGLSDERDATLLLAMEVSEPDQRERLYIADASPETDRWFGVRSTLPSRALEKRIGFAHIGRNGWLGYSLAVAINQHPVLHYLGGPTAYTAEIPRTLDLYQKAAAHQAGGAKIDDMHLALARLRMVKEPRELERMQKAADITVAGHLAAWRAVKPGMSEYELKQLIEETFRKGGAKHLSYASIVGGGPDGCFLHYHRDDHVIGDGELVLVDAGAEYEHYATDVTRTFPANGHFTPEQRKIYDVVLAAQNAALAKVRPGVKWAELTKVAQKVIADAGYYEYFIHGLGHYVGLEVHDTESVSGEEPIPEGAVITIEPGIYIPEKKIGIRIEDTVLVTKSGPKLLSGALPRDADAIEKIVQHKQ